MAKLFNTIIVWDIYAFAENEADARAAALANIQAGLLGDIELPPSEQVAHDVGKRPVRTAWLNQKPLVGNAVSDADFEKVKGKTCEQVWAEINTKPKAESKKEK